MATLLQITYYKSSPSGPGSPVGIATDYGLEGPGSNPGEDKIFRPSRPAPGPTLYNGYRVFLGGRGGRGMGLPTHPHLVPRSQKKKSYYSTHSKELRGL